MSSESVFYLLLNITVVYAMQCRVRQTLKTRTIFNVLGPLINPAKPNIELMGVYDNALVRPIAETLATMGLKRAAVVHGSGLDEVAIHGETHVAEIIDGVITEYTLTPADFGLNSYPLEAIRGGEPKENQAIIKNILTGKGTTGSRRCDRSKCRTITAPFWSTRS